MSSVWNARVAPNPCRRHFRLPVGSSTSVNDSRLRISAEIVASPPAGTTWTGVEFPSAGVRPHSNQARVSCVFGLTVPWRNANQSPACAIPVDATGPDRGSAAQRGPAALGGSPHQAVIDDGRPARRACRRARTEARQTRRRRRSPKGHPEPTRRWPTRAPRDVEAPGRPRLSTQCSRRTPPSHETLRAQPVFSAPTDREPARVEDATARGDPSPVNIGVLARLPAVPGNEVVRLRPRRRQVSPVGTRGSGSA